MRDESYLTLFPYVAYSFYTCEQPRMMEGSMRPWEQANNLADRLRIMLEERGYDQAEFARRSGLSRSYVSMLLGGKRGRRIGRRAAGRIKAAIRVPDSFFDLRSPHMGNPEGETAHVKHGEADGEIQR